MDAASLLQATRRERGNDKASQYVFKFAVVKRFGQSSFQRFVPETAPQVCNVSSRSVFMQFGISFLNVGTALRRLSPAHCALLLLSVFASPAHAHGDFGPLVLAVLGAIIFGVMCFVFLAASMAPPGQKGAWAMITLAGMPLSAMLIFGTTMGAFSQITGSRSYAFIGALSIFLLLWIGVFVHLFRLRKQYARARAAKAAAKAAAAPPPAQEPSPLSPQPTTRAAAAPPRKPVAKPSLSSKQKLGFGLAALVVGASVGTFMFWQQIQTRREVQAEREKAAKEIAQKMFEAEQNARESQRARSDANTKLETNPKFLPISVKELSEDTGNFSSATYGTLSMKQCYVTVTDPASTKSDEAMMVLFRETTTGGIRLFSRGYHSEVELKNRQGSDRNSTSFFGRPGRSQSGDLVLGDGEPRYPLGSDFVIEGGSYKPVKYIIALQITEPLKCDWMKPRCHATGETTLPDLSKATFTEHCASKTDARFFPSFAYPK
jgi:hypothetical protein